MSRLIDFTDRDQVEALTLVRWRIPFYRENAIDPYVETVARFCDGRAPIAIQVYSLPELIVLQTEEFLPYGILLSISETNSEIRATPQGISFSLTAFSDTLGYDIRKVFLNSKILGTTVEMWRVYKDAETGDFLNDNLPVGRFQGVVSNFSIEEDWSPGAQQTTQTVSVQCNSRVEQLSNKVNGCRTNPADRQKFFDFGAGNYDRSMDRVLKLKNANFNFGAPA